jgi:hypothetical protein
MVRYDVEPGGLIVFTAEVDGFGPVTITSRRPGIFNGRLTNRPVLTAALRMVEAFAAAHKDDLNAHYIALAQPPPALNTTGTKQRRKLPKK